MAFFKSFWKMPCTQSILELPNQSERDGSKTCIVIDSSESGKVGLQLTSHFLAPANEVCEGYVFTGVCLSTGGECIAERGVRGRGCAWQGVYMAGGVHGRGCTWQGGVVAGGCAWWGACMTGGMCGRGHAWQGSMCGRGHAWQGGMHGGGHAWHRGACMAQGKCMVGGMHGRGCVWQGGACMVGGMCGGERMHMAWGVCMAGGVRDRYYKIWSMSGQYASHWNVFSFPDILTIGSNAKYFVTVHKKLYFKWIFYFSVYINTMVKIVVW